MLCVSVLRHDVAEIAGLTTFSFGEDEVDRYVMLFKKVRFWEFCQNFFQLRIEILITNLMVFSLEELTNFLGHVLHHFKQQAPSSHK